MKKYRIIVLYWMEQRVSSTYIYVKRFKRPINIVSGVDKQCKIIDYQVFSSSYRCDTW